MRKHLPLKLLALPLLLLSASCVFPGGHGHVHSARCGHYKKGPHVHHVKGHLHGPHCGHVFHGGVWVVK